MGVEEVLCYVQILSNVYLVCCALNLDVSKCAYRSQNIPAVGHKETIILFAGDLKFLII